MIVRHFLMVCILMSQLAPEAWEVVPSGTTQQLRAVYFSTPKKGFVAGDSGTLLRSVDSGRTWNQALLGYSSRLWGVSFRDTLQGVLGGSGGLILVTNDGGETWNRAQTPDSLTEISDVLLMPGTNRGLAVGAKGILRIWRTDDGGNTWILQDTAWPRSNVESALRFTKQPVSAEICFSGLDTGYIASGWAQGTSGLLRTINGGSSWVDHFPRDAEWTTSTGFSGCNFIDGKTGFFVGNYYGEIAKTRTALVDSLYRKAIGSFWGIHFPSVTVGYSVGNLSTAGMIYRSTNSGETWIQQTIPQVQALRRVFFINANYGFAVGVGGAILRTTDGGGSPVNVVPQQRGTSPVRPPFKGSLGRFFDALGRNVRNMQFFARSMDVGG
jgi:photosystem II stability/assembly factor-like uncharacterized protein